MLSGLHLYTAPLLSDTTYTLYNIQKCTQYSVLNFYLKMNCEPEVLSALGAVAGRDELAVAISVETFGRVHSLLDFPGLQNNAAVQH